MKIYEYLVKISGEGGGTVGTDASFDPDHIFLFKSS